MAGPGTSLPRSDAVGTRAEQLLLEVEEVVSTGRRTGRAELDEHAEGVHYSEIDVTLREGRPKEEIEAEIREKLGQIPNISVNVGQPHFSPDRSSTLRDLCRDRGQDFW